MTSQRPVAIITGGCSKIGLHITNNLHSKGYNVCIHYSTNATQSQKLADNLNSSIPNSAIIYGLNFGDATLKDLELFIETVYKSWNRLDVLINNASVFYKTDMTDSEKFSDSFENIFKVNVTTPALLTQLCVKHMKPDTSSKSCVINICDIHGERPFRGFSAYSVSKSALIALTKSLAKELIDVGINVNGVSPGAIFSHPEEVPHGQFVLKQYGDVENITNAINFFIGSNFVTGQVINVDGGRTLNQ